MIDYLPGWPLDITPLMAFGVMLIVGAVGGFAAHHISWLPSITGFLIVGVVIGPSGFGLLSPDVIERSHVIIDIALALILFRLGLSLDVRLIRRSPKPVIISLCESVATFVLVFLVLHLFGIPPLVAMLVAAITISSSPAVLLHVAHEVNASGIVTESTKMLVAMNNFLSFLAFSATLPALHYSSGSDWETIFFQPGYRLAGSIALGAVLGYGMHLLVVRMRAASQYRLALVIGTIMISIAMAAELRLSSLLVPLVIGVVVRTLERDTVVSAMKFGAAFELFFITLFVFAGAGLHLRDLVTFAPAVFALVLARSVAKILGVAAISRVLKRPVRDGFASGMLLIPMAGLAIGLVQTSGGLFPQHAATITAIIFGAVTVFETVGPPVAAFAFRFARETGGNDQVGPVPG